MRRVSAPPVSPPLLYAIFALPLGLALAFLAGAETGWLTVIGVLLALSGIAIIGMMGRSDRRSLLVVPLVIVTVGGSGLWLHYHRRSELLEHGSLTKGLVGGMQQGNGDTSSARYTFYTYTVAGKSYTQPLDDEGYRVGDTITIRYSRNDPGISEVAR